MLIKIVTRYIFTILLLVCNIMPLFAEVDMSKNVSVVLNTNNGLVSSEVTCFIQDNQGFMWIGTTGGLCRYDGYGIKTYKSNYLTPYFFTGNNITCLAKDNNNQLWVGTTSGLNILNLVTGFTLRFSLEDLGCSVINSIVLVNNNEAYIASNIGVLVLNYKTKEVYRLKDSSGQSLESRYVQSLFLDSRNKLWIGLWHTGFCSYDMEHNKFRFYPEIGTKELSTMSFMEDKTGNIWVSTWNTDGLYRIINPASNDLLEFVVYPIKSKNPKEVQPVSIYNIIQDDLSEKIWIATSEGIKYLDDANNTKLIEDCEINLNETISEEIYSIYKDRTGIIWVSTYGSGCYALDLKKNYFQQYFFPEIKGKNEINIISSVFENKDGLLWLGVKSKVMVLFDRKQNKVIPFSNHPVFKNIDLRANTIVSIKARSENEVWLASRYYGIYIAKMQNNIPASVNHLDETKLKSPNLNDVENGKANKMWVGTIKGVNIVTEANGGYSFSSDPLIDQVIDERSINAIRYDGNNTIWIGTQDDGLFKVELSPNGSAKKIHHYSVKENKINNNNIQCIFYDSKNRLWIGTQGGGLSLYNAAKDFFCVIKNMDRMPNDAIYSIEEDKRGNLWLATGKELVKYNPDIPLEYSIRTFSKNDNLDLNSFQRDVSFKSKTGELIFGGNNGLIWFDPETFRDNTFSPNPNITDILVSNKSVVDMTDEERSKIISENPSYAKEIQISYKENTLRIEFASLAFENSRSYKYAYKLEGIDNNWVHTSSKNNFAVYNNLKKGTYTFLVKAYNEDGYASEGVTSLIINRLPAPWETVWAYIIYCCIILGVIFFAYRLIVNRMNMKRKLEIEHMELIKSEEVHLAKMQFFTNVSHELFTPVTVLSCSLDNLLDEYPKEASLIHTMKMNLSRLMRLLQQIMEFRKAETGNLKLKVSSGNIYNFIKEICEVNFYPMVKSTNIHLEIFTNKKDLSGYFDSDKLDKIMFNLLSNAFKYTPVNGHIYVHLKELDDDASRYVEIRVIDTGSGIDPEKLPHLFTRFYEGDYRRFKTTGTGIGLSLTKDLVTLHKGEISVKSKKGKGTEFTILLPIDEISYTKEQIDDLTEGSATDILVDTGELLERDPSNRENIRLLLVEDNPDLLQVMHNTLCKSFDVLTADNGQQALNILNEEAIDIVVTDVVMPIMDGVELCKQMKSKVELSHIPIIILTAKQNSEDKIVGFDAGADAYITKPFDVGSLVANIKSLVRNRRHTSISFQEEDKIKLTKYVYNSVDEDFLQKAIQVVEENVKKTDFNTTDFYQLMNMSQPTLYRKLKSITNLSPNEFIRNIKFKMACKLLTERNLNISETAYELGFVDPRYFSSVFKKEFGMSPSEYVKSYEKNK